MFGKIVVLTLLTARQIRKHVSQSCINSYERNRWTPIANPRLLPRYTNIPEEKWSLYHNESLLIFGIELCESLRDVCRKIVIFHSENFDFWKVRFYNCFICDLNCTIFVSCVCRIMFQLCYSCIELPLVSGQCTCCKRPFDIRRVFNTC